ncbi:hypothetical protein FQN53_000112 [Emmonsiellopsis sp. PD_33]|nr:hypothetical protein FQN53_000112 [Emmonsiellopsis sp. PD_33]
MLLLSTALILLNARSVLSSCAHGTYLHRRAAGGEAIELPNFGYGPDDGPTNWHAISPDNMLCATGTCQSPININGSIAQEPTGIVAMNVAAQDVKFENLGTNVEVVIAGTTMVNGREFVMEQFHFHTPSEHVINGEQFPAEVHMVHSAKDPDNPEEVAVISLVIQATASDSVHSLDTVISHISQIPTAGDSVDITQLDISDIVTTVNALPMFTYTGSLTTPPCTEGVPFFILAEAMPLHIDTVNALKAVVGHNARFLQQNIPAQENVLVAGSKALPDELVVGGTE